MIQNKAIDGLLKLWKELSLIGIRKEEERSSYFRVMLTNRFSFIAGFILCLILILFFVTMPGIGWNVTRVAMLMSAIIFFCVPLINHAGKFTLAKCVISWLPALLIFSISIIDKKTEIIDYTLRGLFVYRFFLMATTIIPVLIFSFREIRLMLFNLVPSFVGTVFFDMIHRPFGVGMNQLGYNEPQIYLIDIMIGLAYFAMVSFLLDQRYVADSYEVKLHKQKKLLKEKNYELEHKNAFINEQNYEITNQTDELIATNKALIQATQTIEHQNKNLEEQVREKTKDLSRVNEELIINNNELRQFSHTLSHNLKSPVATFQGLLNLVERDDLNKNNLELLKYMHRSIDEMQMVFADMNEILELRSQLYTSMDFVDFQQEIDGLYSRFYRELRRNNIQFSCTYSGDKVLKTNEKRLNGILYQLISNAIKFRSEHRNPQIKVKLNGSGDHHSIKIWDNGIGIDMERHGDKLFFPYQRFHKHSAGKGLGLYLVKLQAESLGGTVKINSRPEEFTEIEVLLKK